MPLFTRKTRRRVLVLLAALGLLGSVWIWTLYNNQAWLEDYVVRSLKQRFGASVRYDSLRVHWRGLDLHRVEYRPHAEGATRFHVNAEEVEVRFGYWDLVRLLFRSRQPLLEISIVQPTLYLSAHSFLSPTEKTLPDTSAAILASAADSSWQQLAGQYGIVEVIDLHHGRIVLQDAAAKTNSGGAGINSDGEIEVLREINGWVRTLGNWKAQLKIHGNLAEWESSALALATEIDLRYLALDSLALKVEDWRPRGKLPLPGRVEMREGALNGTIMFTRGPHAAGVNLEGELALRHGQFLCWLDSLASNSLSAPVRVDSMQLRARIERGWLLVEESRQKLNGQPLWLAGRVNVMSLPFFQTLEEIAARALPPSDSAAADSMTTLSRLAPEIDLAFASDSLVLAEWLSPFFDKEKAPPPAARELVAGHWQLSGNVTGDLLAPRLYAKLFNRHGRIYGQRIQYLESQFWYVPSDSLMTRELRWQGSGALAFSLSKKEKAGEQTLEWEGFGKMACGDTRFPLDLTLLTNTSLALPEIKLTPLAPDSLARASLARDFRARKPVAPRLRLSARTRLTGPLAQPQIAGQLECDLERPPATSLRWLGDFNVQQDTLFVRAQRPDLNSQLRAQVWQWRTQPHFRVQGLEGELLSTWLDEKWANSLAADFDFDFTLAGRVDSLTLQAEVKKKANQTTLLELNAYMLPLVQNERVISGALKFFPQRARGFAASYTCHVRDSVITISDLHAEKWLSGNLEIRTAGRRDVRGSLRILGADLAKLIDAERLGEPRYRGQLSAEINLEGTLDEPRGQSSFWLYDGFFNGVGNFFIRGEGGLDSTGWRLSTMKIEKDRKPYLNAAAEYRRAGETFALALQGAGIKSEEFLQALADVPNEKFRGVLSFDLKAQGALANFLSKEGIALSGEGAVRNGVVRWFSFDEITAQIEAGRISRYGMFLPRISYFKQNAFALNGAGFLPFNGSGEMDIGLQGEGNFLAVLPEVASYFKRVESEGKLRLRLAGPYKKIRIPDSRLTFNAARMQLTKIAPEIRNVAGELSTDSRGTFVSVQNIRGNIEDATFTLRNEERVPALPMSFAENLLPRSKKIPADSLVPVPLRLSDSQLYLGALFIKSSANGLPLNIPGLMQKHETGRFWITGLRDSTTARGDAEEFILTGPWAHPALSGSFVMENVNFQFPFEESAETDSAALKVLLNLNWNVLAQSRRDNRYVIAIPTAVDEVFVSLGLDDDESRLKLQGVLADSSFFAEGKITSQRGVVEYLDMSFQVESCGAEFDRSDWLPIVYGRGHAVVTDSTDFPQNVHLTLYTIDPATKQEVPRGRFQNAFFKLSSDNPAALGDTQGQLLATLGYSAARLGQNAKDAVSIGTDHLIIRPILRPVERALERTLGLDVVRFSSRFTRNLLTTSNAQNGTLPPNSIIGGRPPLLRNSRLTLGKHLSHSLYLHYVGQIETGLVESELINATEEKIANWYYDLQLRHRLGLEYRLNPSMLLQFEYDYNPLLLKDKADPRIWLRHSFPVEFPLKEGK